MTPPIWLDPAGRHRPTRACAGPVAGRSPSCGCAPSTCAHTGGSLGARSTFPPGVAARPSMCRCRCARAGGSSCRSGSPSRCRIRPNDLRQFLDRRRPREAAAALRRRPQAALELPDQALELGHPLAQGGVLGVEPGDRGPGLTGPSLPPSGDAAPRGADPLWGRPVWARPQTAHRPGSGGLSTAPSATFTLGPRGDPGRGRRWREAWARDRGRGGGTPTQQTPPKRRCHSVAISGGDSGALGDFTGGPTRIPHSPRTTGNPSRFGGRRSRIRTCDISLVRAAL
jgi:hypothetical protein